MDEDVKVTKISVARYVFYNVAVPLMIVFVVIISGFIVNGLYGTYLNKKLEVRRFAKVMARSAAHEDFDLISVLVSESLNQDPTLKDIRFYSIDSPVEFDDYIHHDWRNTLINSTVSFHEGVMVTIDGKQSLAESDNTQYQMGAGNQPSSPTLSNSLQPDNTALAGYINVTLDLQALRYQWFKDNIVSLISLPIIAIIFLWHVYWRIRLPTMHIVKMSRRARRILKQDSLDLGAIVHSEKGFAELETIRQLIVKLDNRYKDAALELESLRSHKLEASSYSQGSTQDKDLRSMVIHGLKGSLNTVLDGLKLLDNYYITDEQSEAINAIRKGSKELDFTLNQIVLLDLIEKGVVGVSLGELQPAQLLNSLVQDYQSTANEKGLKLIVDINHVDHVLAGDIQKTRNILEELISNAIKYTSIGSVTISSRLDYFAQSIRWSVQVKDTGVGIEQKYIDDLFVPFFRGSDNSETMSDGIGLSVAQRLTKLLGGELSVESAKNKGTTFTFVLQLKDWRDDESFRMLHGLSIVGLQGLEPANYMQKLETYGAEVQVFSDSFTLIEYVTTNPVDIILLAESLKVNEVEAVCTTLRAREDSSRVITAWYITHSITEKQQASLEAIGLDYMIEKDTSLKEQAGIIKGWMMR